jgi:hypothetical protein
MKYEVRTNDGDTSNVDCEYITVKEGWILFERADDSRHNLVTVAMLRVDSVLSVKLLPEVPKVPDTDDPTPAKPKFADLFVPYASNTFLTSYWMGDWE